MLIDPAQGIITYNRKQARLSKKQMELFLFLYNYRGRPVKKEAMMHHLYQLYQEEPDMKIIDVMICHIRRKTKPLGIEIRTVWGFGYLLDLPRDQSIRTIKPVTEDDIAWL